MNIEDTLRRVAAGTSTLDDSLVLGNELERRAAEITRLHGVEDRLAAVMTDSHLDDQGERVPVLEWLARTNQHVRSAITLTDDHVDSAVALANAGRHRRPRRRGPLGLVVSR